MLTPKDALSMILIATFSPVSTCDASFTFAKPPRKKEKFVNRQ